MFARSPFVCAAALALPLVFGLACNDDNGGPAAETFLVQGGDMAARHEHIHVSNDGTAVSDATVTVNGELASPGPNGEYVVTLPGLVPAGDPLTLEVEAGGETITATGIVPDAPDVTAPDADAVVLTSAAIDVTWSSATDPDRFVVLAEGATTERFDAAGTARAFSIPAGALPAGHWEILVYAYNDGSFTGPTEAGSAMNIRGQALVYPSVTIVRPVLVQGADMGNQVEHIVIRQGELVVDGATVTVNGEAAVQSAPGSNYDVTLAAPVGVGGLLNLDISFGFGPVVIQGTGAVPESPVITAPAEGAIIAVANAIDVTWTSTTNPDRFRVYVQTGAGVMQFDAAGTARTLTIPANTLPLGGPYPMDVFAYNDGTFTGPVNAESTMNIRGEDRVNITIIP